MEKNKFPLEVKNLMQKIIDKGGDIFVIGGAVRDILLKKGVKDWDFTSNLTPEQIQRIFPKNSFCTTSRKFSSKKPLTI